MQTPALPSVSAGHLTRRSCTVAPPKRSASARSRHRAERGLLHRLASRGPSLRTSRPRMVRSRRSRLSTPAVPDVTAPEAVVDYVVTTDPHNGVGGSSERNEERERCHHVRVRQSSAKPCDHEPSTTTRTTRERPVDERIAAFGGQPCTEAVRHAAEGSAKAVTKSPAPEPVCPKRRERPPAPAEVGLHLDQLSAAGIGRVRTRPMKSTDCPFRSTAWLGAMDRAWPRTLRRTAAVAEPIRPGAAVPEQDISVAACPAGRTGTSLADRSLPGRSAVTVPSDRALERFDRAASIG